LTLPTAQNSSQATPIITSSPIFISSVYFTVGTTWDKDFRVVLVLSTLKMDQQFDKNSEFYIPEEQVSATES
jgi:hypothetical protein